MGTWNSILGSNLLSQRDNAHELMSHDATLDETYRISVSDFIDGLGAGESEAIIGEIRMFAGAEAPDKWLPCDGRAISRTTYSALFTLIGESFGVGDGTTTFNIPDFQGRMPIGIGAGEGLSERVIAEEGGEEDHTLSIDEIPSHSHGISPLGTGTVSSGSFTFWRAIAETYNTQETGGDEAHNNLPPYLCVGFIVYTGVSEE